MKRLSESDQGNTKIVNVSDPTNPQDASTKAYTDTKLPLAGGTLSGDLLVPDEAYGSGWDGSLEVPTKNAVYDKIETLGGISAVVDDTTPQLGGNLESNGSDVLMANTDAIEFGNNQMRMYGNADILGNGAVIFDGATPGLQRSLLFPGPFSLYSHAGAGGSGGPYTPEMNFYEAEVEVKANGVTDARFNVNMDAGLGIKSNGQYGIIQSENLTGTHTYQLPNADGTLALLADIPAGAAWGDITGTLADQTDLQTALDSKITDDGDITADTINEKTSGSGVTIESVLLKDGNLGLGSLNGIQAGHAYLGMIDDYTATQQIQLGGPGNYVVGTTSAQTLSEKRLTPRTASTTSASSLTPDLTNDDVYIYTALAANLTVNAPTGTPVDGDKLLIRIKDNGTSRTLTWNAIYRSVGATLPTATTISKEMYLAFFYNSGATKWDLMALSVEGSPVTGTDANAVHFSDTSTSGMGFVVDEDAMTSDSATKVPTQQSTKAYVDSKAQVSVVSNEVPSGTINGSNTAFTLASAPATGSVRVFLNGVRQKITDDYTVSGSTVTFVTAPPTGSNLLVDYNISNSTFSIGTNSYIAKEAVTGSVNGSNTVFTTARAYIAGSLQVFVNGLMQSQTMVTETTPSSGTFTLDAAPATGDVLHVAYQYNLNPSGNADTVDGIHASSTATANQLYPLKASTTDANGWKVIDLGWCTKYTRKGNVTGAAITAGNFAYVATGINLPVGCSWVGDYFTGGIVVNDQAISASFTYNGGDNVRFAVQNQWTGGSVTPTIYWTLEFTKYNL